MRAIRTTDYKLVFYAGRDYGELYDMRNDPAEGCNLWSREDCRQIREQLKDRLNYARGRVSAGRRPDKPGGG